MREPRTPSRKVLNRDEYVPGHLVKLANGMSRSASRLYLSLFDVGIIEWRILSILSIESYVTAQRISEAIELDKGAASRNIRVMENKGLIKLAEDVTDNRRRPITLTEAGKVLHAKILAIVIRRQRLLLGGLSQQQIDQLLATLKQMEVNLEHVRAYDEGLIKASGNKPKRVRAPPGRKVA